MGIHSLAEIEACARSALARKGHAQVADFAAPACTFLEGVGYPGLKQLAEALSDSTTTAVLEKDLMGVDLQGVSCVFLGPEIERLTREHGRLFLRNVRHGLFLLPYTVRDGLGIGCPVDPAFALGGERHKNPYGEKLALAEAEGIEVDEGVWAAIKA